MNTERFEKKDKLLVVDLDGTLSSSDVFVESIAQLISHTPTLLPKFLVSLSQGRANAKAFCAKYTEVDHEKLPYRQEALDFLAQEAPQYKQVVLSTGTHEAVAQKVADHLGGFDKVHASTRRSNNIGEQKLQALAEDYPDQPFDYVGDSRADKVIWRQADKAIYIGKKTGYLDFLKDKATQSLSVNSGRVSDYIKLLRPHQWVKNLLVFVPLITGHHFLSIESNISAFLAFILMSICASATYIFNDLCDVESDRCHPTKCERPLANGSVELKSAIKLMLVMIGVALLGASLVSLSFLGILLLYIALTVTYSITLKRKVIVDVITLASLYTVRLLAGAVAIGIVPSFWLLSFSMFVFYSLALVKRYSELKNLLVSGADKSFRRGYRVHDIQQIEILGIGSALISVLVLANFLNAPDLVDYYTYPMALWLICPIYMYWISRIWMLAGREKMTEDPIVFAIRDRISRITGTLLLAIMVFAY